MELTCHAGSHLPYPSQIRPVLDLACTDKLQKNSKFLLSGLECIPLSQCEYGEMLRLFSVEPFLLIYCIMA